MSNGAVAENNFKIATNVWCYTLVLMAYSGIGLNEVKFADYEM